MERQGVLIDFDVTALDVGDEHSHCAPGYSEQKNRLIRRTAYFSVAIWSLAIAVKSSALVAAERLVNGVLVLPATDPAGVDPDVVPPLSLAACFAAFSASRFCLDAEGAIEKSEEIDVGDGRIFL